MFTTIYRTTIAAAFIGCVLVAGSGGPAVGGEPTSLEYNITPQQPLALTPPRMEDVDWLTYSVFSGPYRNDAGDEVKEVAGVLVLKTRRGRVSYIAAREGPWAYLGANNISSNGRVCGAIRRPYGITHPMIVRHGQPIDIGTLGGQLSTAMGINARGWVVGSYGGRGDPQEHACIWRNGRVKDLGSMGGTWSIAYDINDRGEVVGEAGTPPTTLKPHGGSSFAFIWRKGHMYDLNTLVHWNERRVHLIRAFRIDNEGRIWAVGDESAPPPPFPPPFHLLEPQSRSAARSATSTRVSSKSTGRPASE